VPAVAGVPPRWPVELFSVTPRRQRSLDDRERVRALPAGHTHVGGVRCPNRGLAARSRGRNPDSPAGAVTSMLQVSVSDFPFGVHHLDGESWKCLPWWACLRSRRGSVQHQPGRSVPEVMSENFERRGPAGSPSWCGVRCSCRGFAGKQGPQSRFTGEPTPRWCKSRVSDFPFESTTFGGELVGARRGRRAEIAPVEPLSVNPAAVNPRRSNRCS